MRPRKSNPSKQNLAERRWYERNKSFKKKRANSRNKARRKVAATVGKSKIKGKEIDHKDGNPMNNSRKNLRVAPKSHGRKKYSRKGGTYSRYK
jgi:hypothetical protein